MVKKPTHKATKWLEQKVKQSQEWSKKTKAQVFAHIADYLDRCWERQIAKSKDKTQKLIRELETIGSKK